MGELNKFAQFLLQQWVGAGEGGGASPCGGGQEPGVRDGDGLVGHGRGAEL